MTVFCIEQIHVSLSLIVHHLQQRAMALLAPIDVYADPFSLSNLEISLRETRKDINVSSSFYDA